LLGKKKASSEAFFMGEIYGIEVRIGGEELKAFSDY
jgi:hypothetical protein